MSERFRLSAGSLGLALACVLYSVGCSDSGETPEVLVQRGNLLLDEGRTDEAEDVYREAIKGYEGYLEDEPENSYVWFEIGELYFRLGQNERAVEAYEKAMEFSSEYQENPYAWYQVATTYDRLENAEAALEAYNNSIRYDPDNSVAYNDRGWLYFNALDESELALRDFNAAIRLAPDDVYPIDNRATVYAQRGDFELAVADMTRALKLQPNLFNLYAKRGDYHLELERFEEAVADYTQALQMDTESAFTYLQRGLAYRGLGDTEAAERDFQFASQIDPTVVPPPETAVGPVQTSDLKATVIGHLEHLGYANLQSTPTETFELQGDRDGQTASIFVAARTGAGTVRLMQADVEAFRASERPVDLVVVSQPASGDNAEVISVISDWSPDEADLKPIQFEVAVP